MTGIDYRDYQLQYGFTRSEENKIMWETVTKQGPSAKYDSYSDTPLMIVYPNGDAAFTDRAFEIMGSPDHVNVLRDRQRGMFGIRRTSEADHNGYKLTQNHKSSRDGSTGKRMARLVCKEIVDSGLARPGYISLWFGKMEAGVFVIDASSSPWKSLPYIKRSRRK